MSAYELAQLNIGVIRGPIDSPVMAEFVANLDRINALAERTPGFVWRLQTEEGNATAIRPYPENENMAVNLSVWKDVDSLRLFVFQSEHVEIMRRRREWFEKMDEAFLVLWWVPKGHRPSHRGGEGQAGSCCGARARRPRRSRSARPIRRPMRRKPRRPRSATSAPPPDVSDRDRIQEDCNRVLDAFMDALNAYDAAGMDRCMHFPHPRIADGKVVVYDKPGNNPMDLFDRLKKEDGWSYSRWVKRKVDPVQRTQGARGALVHALARRP